MRRIDRIPQELLKNLERRLTVGSASPAPTPAPATSILTISDLINTGRAFYSNETDSSGRNIGVASSLRQALDYAPQGIATLPYLIAGKAQADKENYLWKNWYAADEEHVGIDKRGIFGEAGKPVVLVVHSNSSSRLLIPARIIKAYEDGLTPQNAAKLIPKEFDDLILGKLPSGIFFPIYTVTQIKLDAVPTAFGTYAVAVPFEAAKAQASGQLTKKQFMENPLVIARAGMLDHLDDYFEKAKSSEKVGNYHRFAEIDPTIPQGRVLFVDINYGGLIGDDLNISGRFVGVAPKAPSEVLK